MKFTDRADLNDVQAVGKHLHVSARVARAGNVQSYLGIEMGVNDRATVRIYRPVETVFDTASMETFGHKIVTLDHPAEDSDFERDGVGWIGDSIARDGEFVRVPMVIAAKRAVDAIQSGKRELSVGYRSEIEWKPGISDAGEPYDAIMNNISVDHVAIVDRARGGTELRIGDAADTWGAAPITMSDKKEDPMSDALKTVVLGDKAVKVALSDEAIIEAFKADAAKKLTDAEADHAKAIATKDAELAQKDGEIADLQGKVLSDADLDKRVQDRATLIDSARKIAPTIDVAGLSDAAIRRKAVEAVRGTMDGKSDAYVDASFDLAVEAAGKGADTFRAAAKDGAPPPAGTTGLVDAARARYPEQKGA